MTKTMVLRGARLVRIGEGGVGARTVSDDEEIELDGCSCFPAAGGWR